MISFFSHPFIAPAASCEFESAPSAASLAPLLRLLDEFDSHHSGRSQQQQATQPRCRPARTLISRRATHTFKPKFDVRETATSYELHGELPGLERDNVQIEFVDPQTLVIRGRVERTYKSSNDNDSNKPEAETEAENVAAAETTTPAAVEPAQQDAEAEWEEVQSTTSSSSSTKYHHATVEDDTEDGDNTNTASASAAAPKNEVTKPAPEEVQKAAVPSPVAAAPASGNSDRYWLSERSVGEFSRAFSFATRVEQDRVTATLDNGVLSVSVPKAPRHIARRVAIF